MAALRREFPILDRSGESPRLIYLDNAATTQKPRAVIDRLVRYYQNENANVHRGVYALAGNASHEFEHARSTIQRFINAAHPDEIVFVRGTTEAINLVATSFGRETTRTNDLILVSTSEHHSNFLPWQALCEHTGARLEAIPITDSTDFDLDAYSRLLAHKVRLVAVNHVSNVTGTVNPVQEIVRLAHEHGVPVVVDGAQAAARIPVDVQALGCDFYAFSGHKLFGPV